MYRDCNNLSCNQIGTFLRIYLLRLFNADLRISCRFIIVFLVSMGLASGLKAQVSILDKPFIDDLRFNKIVSGTYMRLNMKISDVQGTPYLNENYETGRIITQDTIFENIALRYNAFSDDLEFKQGENTYNIGIKNIVKKAVFGDNIFTYRSYEIDGATRDGFFRILTEGKANLLVRYTIKFLDSEEAKAFSDYKPVRFDDIEKQFFIAIQDYPAKLVGGKKVLLSILGDNKNEMDAFISKNKLSIKDEEELKKIILHFNSL